MAVIASALVSLSTITDVASTTRYYLLQSSTLAKPSKPTANPPGEEWNDTEPTYTAESTDSMYFVDLTVFSDGTYSYSEVSLSSSYEAAKQAANDAAAAKNMAFIASDDPPTSCEAGYRWLDTGVTPRKQRIWMGADAPTGRDGGTVTQTFTYHAPDATSWTPSQSGSGTASMTNIRPLNAPKESAYFTRSDGVVCKATFASPVYGGSINSSGVVTRTYGYIELSGNESWEIYNSAFYIAYYGGANYGQGKGRGNAGDSVFSHGGSRWTSSSPNCNVDRDINLQGFLSTYSTVDALKTYLKSEKAAGHPLEVAYYLSASQTVSTTIEPIEPNVLTIDNTKGQIVSDITIKLDSTATADTTVYVNGTAYTIATGELGVTITGIEKTTYEIYGSTKLTISYDANGWETVNDTSAIEQGVSNAQSAADAANTAAGNAQSTADAAKSDAANAQSTADTAKENAATAQSTADTAKSDAAAAQSTADAAKSDAAAAQSTADAAKADAATALESAYTVDEKLGAATLAASEIEKTANAAKRQAEANADNFRRFIRLDNKVEDGGLIIGDNTTNSYVRIRSDSVELCVDVDGVSVAVATFAHSYLRLRNMQVRVPDGVGGLVLSVYEA